MFWLDMVSPVRRMICGDPREKGWIEEKVPWIRWSLRLWVDTDTCQLQTVLALWVWLFGRRIDQFHLCDFSVRLFGNG